MIRINLLPEGLRRPPESPRVPRTALLCLGVVFVASLCLIARHALFVLPALRSERAALEEEGRGLREAARERAAADREARRRAARVDAVRGLYARRVVWARVLFDVREAVDAVSGAGGMRLTGFKGEGKGLALDGLAASLPEPVAGRMPERFLRALRESGLPVEGTPQIRSASWAPAAEPGDARTRRFTVTMLLE